MDPNKPPEQQTGLLAAAAAPAAPKAADMDLNAAAGNTVQPTAWKPSDNAMAATQLTKLLGEDSKYMQMARAGAARAANSRGLLNSSIAAGAGEAAAIQSALPIAQQDAQTWGNSEQFNAGQTNEFARDTNLFTRQGVLAKFNAANEAEQRGLDRDHQFSMQRDQQSFQGTQAGLERAQQEAMTRLNAQLQTDFEKARLPMTMMAEAQKGLQEYVGKIMADPNLDAAAKDAAIANYYKYQQSQFGWMSTFFNTQMPNIMGGSNIQPYVQGSGNPGAGVTAGSGTTPTITAPVDVGVPPPTYASPDRQIPDPVGGAVGSGLPSTGDQFERFDRWNENRL
jgi:hypothetical protein